MEMALAAVAIVVSLLCTGMVIWLASQFFRQSIEIERLKYAQEQGTKNLTESLTATQRKMQEIEAESKSGVETGLYTPIKDKVTGKVEMKMVQDYGQLEGLSFDEIMKRAQDLADGKVKHG